MALYPLAAIRRAMRVQEVILPAMSGEITRRRVAGIFGISARNLRRWKWRYGAHGHDGLLDRRTGQPSTKRAPLTEVAKKAPRRAGLVHKGRPQRLQRQFGGNRVCFPQMVYLDASSQPLA
jgi:transposase